MFVFEKVTKILDFWTMKLDIRELLYLSVVVLELVSV